MFYEFKVKTTKDNAKGEPKEVTERYFTEKELFSEVEATGLGMYEDADVVAISRSDVREVVNPEASGEGYGYYKATIVDIFVRVDGTQKELKYKVLVAADSVQQATKLVQDYMKQGLQDMRLDAVKSTKILEIV